MSVLSTTRFLCRRWTDPPRWRNFRYSRTQFLILPWLVLGLEWKCWGYVGAFHSPLQKSNQSLQHIDGVLKKWKGVWSADLSKKTYVDSTNWWGSMFHQIGIWFLRYPLSGYSCHKRRNGPLPLLWGRLVRWPWESEEGPYSRLCKMVEFITNHIVIYMYLTWLFNTYYFFLSALIQTR